MAGFAVASILIGLVWSVLTILSLRCKPLFYAFLMPQFLLVRAIRKVIAGAILGPWLLYEAIRRPHPE